MVWNGTEVAVWNMEDFRMELNPRCQEWNGKQSSILLHKFHTKFCALYLQKNKYRCLVVMNNIVKEVFNYNMYAYYLSTNRNTLVVYIALTVYVMHHCKYIAICSIDDIIDDFDRFDFFFFRLTICQVLNCVFVHRQENSYLLFNSNFRFSLTLFILQHLDVLDVFIYIAEGCR